MNNFVTLQLMLGGTIKTPFTFIPEKIRNFSLFVLLVFVFGSLQSLAVKPSQTAYNLVDKTSYFSVDLVNKSHLPSHFPFEPASSPYQTEDPDENELKEHLSDDGNFCLWKQSFKNYFKTCTSSLGHQFNLLESFKGRSKISFFILYHSWKSYLI
jgi:hypothetical protein